MNGLLGKKSIAAILTLSLLAGAALIAGCGSSINAKIKVSHFK